MTAPLTPDLLLKYYLSRILISQHLLSANRKFYVIIFIILVHKCYNAFHNTLLGFQICGELRKFENLIMGYVLHWYFQTEKLSSPKFTISREKKNISS